MTMKERDYEDITEEEAQELITMFETDLAICRMNREFDEVAKLSRQLKKLREVWPDLKLGA